MFQNTHTPGFETFKFQNIFIYSTPLVPKQCISIKNFIEPFQNCLLFFYTPCITSFTILLSFVISTSPQSRFDVDQFAFSIGFQRRLTVIGLFPCCFQNLLLLRHSFNFKKYAFFSQLLCTVLDGSFTCLLFLFLFLYTSGSK